MVDSNTSVCLPGFVGQLSHLDGNFEILEVEPGEEVNPSKWPLDYGPCCWNMAPTEIV